MRPNIAQQVDESFYIIMGISVILLMVITAAMLYFLYKYNAKRHPVAENIEGNTTVEIVWTVIPVILVLFMFYISWTGFKNMRDVPKDAMVVKVNGQMWKWSFEYDNKKKSDTLYLPVNKNVKFEITATDVNHSFYLPQFRVKEDAVPGRTNYYWIRTDKVGTFYAACAEYCGLNHSYMYATMKVLPEEEFLVWKNYFPSETGKDTTATKTDSLKTSSTVADTLKNKTDSLKTTSTVRDTSKSMKDSLKTDSLKKK